MIEQREDRPSSYRRKVLRDEDSGSAPEISSFFPLESYYNASEKLLASFGESFESKELDNAYVYGIRYCDFAMSCLKKHDYFKQPRYRHLESKMTRQVADVLSKLEEVADLMDLEELEKERVRKEKEEAERRERERKEEEERNRQLEELQARISNYKVSARLGAVTSIGAASNSPSELPGHAPNDSGSNSNNSSSVQMSAFAKLQRLAQQQNGGQSATPFQPMPPPVPPPSSTASDNGGQHGSSTDISLLQPVLPPTTDTANVEDDGRGANEGGNGVAPPPPSYTQASALRESSYFGPGRDKNDKPKKSVSFGEDQVRLIPANNKHRREEGPPPYDQATSGSDSNMPKKHRRKKRNPSIQQIVDQANHDYHEFQAKKHITVSSLGTYQGRVGGSTNGCTVISALCASKHLESPNGLTTPLANQVIDQTCVPLLRRIRSKLQLGEGSLIIPSDVHDHLVDAKLLFQHKFVGASGGNILDPEHIETVLSYLHYGHEDSDKAMKEGLMGRKAAATLFFKEHVISIVKFPTSQTTAVYDLIDSLPRSGTGRGSRTRCNGIDALRVLLMWYACSKFSPSNIKYMSSHPWEETMADFDPRVFQAFVWSDQPMPKQ